MHLDVISSLLASLALMIFMMVSALRHRRRAHDPPSFYQCHIDKFINRKGYNIRDQYRIKKYAYETWTHSKTASGACSCEQTNYCPLGEGQDQNACNLQESSH